MLTQEQKLIYAEMVNLLEEYDYSYTQSALEDIILEWASQKHYLINLFKKHPNYVEGKFLIAFDTSYERTINISALWDFRRWLIGTLGLIILPDEVKARRENIEQYLPQKIYDYITDLHRWAAERTINEEHAKKLKEILPEIHSHVGEKTSRVINKLCNYLGWSKIPEYNREYARFADALSPITIKRHTVLSLHPLDYLTMSFGNSWASCHTIDKRNKRGMPNSYEGQYSSGTMSYMLDSTSMVLYTVDAEYDGTDYWTQPKITRQMFHWGEDKLIQGRLYPQDNDDDGEAYTPYRNIVQAIMAQVLDVPNLWTFKRGVIEYDEVCSYGTHYQDYHSYSNVTLSRLKDAEDHGCIMTIGAEPICIECGQRHSISENINHCSDALVCAYCGERIRSGDDVYWIGDIPYCYDCVSYCEHCDEYHPNDRMYWIDSENRYVCRSCRDNYYARCDICGDWHHIDDLIYTECDERNVCPSCFHQYYTTCDYCDNYVDKCDIIELDNGDCVCPDCAKKEGE